MLCHRPLQVVREVCTTIALCARQLRDDFAIMADSLLPALFRTLHVTIAVIAQAGHQVVVCPALLSFVIRAVGPWWACRLTCTLCSVSWSCSTSAVLARRQ